MLYARSHRDFANMVECLAEEFAAVGLNLNSSKTKLLTTENLNEPMFLNISGDMIEVLHGRQNLKYVGKNYLVTSGKGPWWIYNIGVRSLG